MVKQALRSTTHRERMRSSYTSYIGSFVDGYPYSYCMKPSACHGQAGSMQQSTCRRARRLARRCWKQRVSSSFFKFSENLYAQNFPEIYVSRLYCKFHLRCERHLRPKAPIIDTRGFQKSTKIVQNRMKFRKWMNPSYLGCPCL